MRMAEIKRECRSIFANAAYKTSSFCFQFVVTNGIAIMADVLRPIEQLKLKGPFHWVLDWFGGIVKHPSTDDTLSIECILTPCTPDPTRPTGLKRHIGHQVAGTIGVCAINAFRAGGTYVNGKLIPLKLAVGSPEEVIKFRFDSRRKESVTETFLDRIGITEHSALINQKLTSGGLSSPVKLVDGLLTATSNTRTRDRNASSRQPFPFRVMFHELEIIRFYYTNSSFLTRHVFSDSFCLDQLYRRVVYSKHEGPYCSLDEEKARFEYYLGFYDNDLPIIGRILFDPTETALQGVRRIYKSMQVSKLNEVSNYGAAYPRSLFPYLDKVELTLVGRRLKLDDGNYIFAVHRIESCNANFPYEKLSFQRSTEPGGQVKAPPEADAAFKNTRPMVKGPGQNSGEMDTEGRPFLGSEFADCQAEHRAFLGLAKVRFIREKVRDNTYNSDERPRSTFNPELNKSSPGTPTSGRSEAVNQKILDQIVSSNIPVDIETFIDILSMLRVQCPQWKLSTIQMGENAWIDPSSKVIYSGFPSIACPERKSVFRQFSFHDKEKTNRRHLVGVQIYVNGKVVYLLEAERRRNDQGKDIEVLPILVLWAVDFAEIRDAIFKLVLAETVENPSKTWPQDLSKHGLLRDSIEHRRESRAAKKDESLTDVQRRERKIKEAVDRIQKCITGLIEEGG